MNKTKSGFTLLEMLLVIAIAAMILSTALVLLGKGKERSRDSRREEDIKEIQNALGLYAAGHHTYPVCSRGVINGSFDCLSQALLVDSLMSSVPTDPIGRGNGTCGDANSLVYCYESDGFDYTLGYVLETDSITGKNKGLQNTRP